MASRYEVVTGERSTVDLIKDIVTDIQGLIRSEIRLANAEMKEKVVRASRASIALVGGGILMLYAFGFLLTCIYSALNVALWPWLSALLVFIGLAIAGSIMLSFGWGRLKQVKPKPEMTVATMKEDVRWLRNQTR